MKPRPRIRLMTHHNLLLCDHLDDRDEPKGQAEALNHIDRLRYGGAEGWSEIGSGSGLKTFIDGLAMRR